MRSSTSFAVLALLATAGSSLGAPIRLDSQPRANEINAHSADKVKPITGPSGSGVYDPRPISKDAHLKDDRVKVLPADKPVSGKDGVVDVQQGNLAGHVIQTPGKDKTMAEVQVGDGTNAHKTDVKVNAPMDGPAGDVGRFEGKNTDQYGNVVGQVVGDKDKRPKDVVNVEPVAKVQMDGQPKKDQPNPKPKPQGQSANANSNPPPASSQRPKPAQSSQAPKPAQSSNAPKPAQSSAAPRPAQSQAPPPAQSSQAAPASQNAQGASAAQSSQAPPPPASSSSHAPPRASSSAPAKSSGNGNGNGKGGNNANEDDNAQLGPGVFFPARPGKGNDNVNTSSNSGNSNSNNGSGKQKPNGDGHTIGVSSSTRRETSSGPKVLDLRIARAEIGKLPSNVKPCDEATRSAKAYGSGEIVDMCIEADLLAYAPSHTFRCPDEMQHMIHVHADSTNGNALDKSTMNTKMSKEIAKYVRLCIDAGAV